ncbi:MAG: hypothetical protein ABWY36_03950 [Leifsonia sp.]
MTDTEAPLSTGKSFAGILPVWIVAVAGALFVGLSVAPQERFGALCLSLAGCAILAFCIQLAVRRRDGFVARVVISIVGAVVIASIAGIVIALTL